MRFFASLLCLLPFAAVGQTPAVVQTPRAGFNPDISLILAGGYRHVSNDPDQYRIPGFMLGAEAGPGARGLSLAESELILSANIDSLFYGQLTAAITPQHELELEEAFVQTLGLTHGLGVRAGRFYSGIGYLNSQHPHNWDFADTALPYRALLAGQYGDDGVRVSWVAPTPMYLELGSEWLRGENFPAAGAAGNGQGVVTAFARTGGDLGASHAWRAGLAFLRAQADRRLSGAIDTAPDAFHGESRLAIADVVWKWAPHGNARQRHLKFQVEYLWRDEDGEFTADVQGPAPLTDVYRAQQSGWYAQTVYQFRPRWRAGLRYDQVRTHELAAGANDPQFDTRGHTPRRATVMLDYSHSEYSRLRLQLTRDRSQADRGSEIMLHYIMSLGAHGAHAF